jgi:hypothetical protein
MHSIEVAFAITILLGVQVARPLSLEACGSSAPFTTKIPPLALYKSEERIFLSWDSASWHASNALYKVVDEINSDKFRSRHKTPLVELMPLPSGAQFLK